MALKSACLLIVDLVISSETSLSSLTCQVPILALHYFELCSMGWVAIEAYYLHLLIYITFVSADYNRRMVIFHSIGYGAPAILIFIWASLKIANGDNERCWHSDKHVDIVELVWKGPRLAVNIFNFTIFASTLKALVSTFNKIGTDSINLAKATLSLIPLFGLHEIIDVQRTLYGADTGGETVNYIIVSYFIKKVNCEMTTVSKVGCLFESTFASLQGFLVATVYCLFSKDVGMEVKNYLKKAQGNEWLNLQGIGLVFGRKSSLKTKFKVRKQTDLEAEQRLKDHQVSATLTWANIQTKQKNKIVGIIVLNHYLF